MKEWVRITSNTGQDILVLCSNVHQTSIQRIREHCREDEIKELLSSKGGVEEGIDLLENYRTCLEYFAGIAAL